MNDLDGRRAEPGRRGFLLGAARGLLLGGLAFVTGRLLAGRRRSGTSAPRRLDCPARGVCFTCPGLAEAEGGCELPQAELARRASSSARPRRPGRDNDGVRTTRPGRDNDGVRTTRPGGAERR